VAFPSPSPLSPIRVAPGSRYFETFDGEPFLFLGPNDALPWPGLAGLFRQKDLRAVDEYLAGMAASGVTVLRLMLEYAHREHRYFEKPVGRFVPAMVRLWDDLFAACARHGLRILLAPWDNFWMARRWHRHPYNRVNGGPAEGPHSFFTDEATIAATINRFRFVIERWGGDGVIAAWDLFNEIDPYWGGGPEEQGRVIARVSNAIREAEQKTWGFTRPQTVSIFGPDPDANGYGDLIFRHPWLDFTTTHVYHHSAIDYPRDTVTPALVMARWVRHALDRTPPDRPYTDTEHGPIHAFNDHRKILPEAFDDEYERHLMWAHLATGGAGGGMRWPARHPHLLTAGMKRALRDLSDFARLVDWRHFAPRDALPNVLLEGDGTETVHVFGCRDEEQAILWLLRGLPHAGFRGQLPAGREPLVGLRLRLRGGLRSGDYQVSVWDTVRGRTMLSVSVHAGDEGLFVMLPPLAADLALAVRPAEQRRAA